MTGPLARWRRRALAAIAALIALATVMSLARSATGLYDWAAGHRWPWWSAWSLPAMVDVFIVVGELALFVGMVDRWRWRWRAMGWAAIGLGWAVSVTGNIGHGGFAQPVATMVTYGIPPTAAAGALLIGLGVLKHTVARAPGTVSPPVAADAETAAAVWLAGTIAAGNPATDNKIAANFGLKRTEVARVRQRVAVGANGHQEG